jgi:hypothetical protein
MSRKVGMSFTLIITSADAIITTNLTLPCRDGISFIPRLCGESLDDMPFDMYKWSSHSGHCDEVVWCAYGRLSDETINFIVSKSLRLLNEYFNKLDCERQELEYFNECGLVNYIGKLTCQYTLNKVYAWW